MKENDHTKPCLGCGNKFFAPTKRARFCSDDCRIFYWREKKRQKAIGTRYYTLRIKQKP